MRPRVLKRLNLQQCNYTVTAAQYSTQRPHPKPIAVLPDSSIATFRAQAFDPAVPALLPRRTFLDIPAISKWFIQGSAGLDRGEGQSVPALDAGHGVQGNETTRLNSTYLSRFEHAHVPLELSDDSNDRFERIQQSLAFFLEVASSTSTQQAGLRIYLAQASLSDLPTEMRLDVPTPALLQAAGRGDIYDASIWLGAAPTYTPLHRDPNPNLFVQLAGRKRVRMVAPREGHGIFARVQERIGGQASATMRGEEMMQGLEKKVLEEEIWENDGEEYINHAWEAEVDVGDGLFIPKGWWHSIKGVGTGMTGSVNWWFR